MLNDEERPTPRAADLGYAPRYLDIFLALSFPVSAANPRSHPKRLTPAVGRQSVINWRKEKKMKPAYWIGILALLGAIVGYIMFRSTGWLGSGIGTVGGIVIGVLVYNLLTRKTK
jgi:hypothetical protein